MYRALHDQGAGPLALFDFHKKFLSQFLEKAGFTGQKEGCFINSLHFGAQSPLKCGSLARALAEKFPEGVKRSDQAIARRLPPLLAMVD